MGLEQGGSRKTFLSVNDGKITRRVEEGTPNAVKKTKKDGTHYHELQYPAVSGYIVGVNKRETQWGTNLAIDISDNGELFSLEMPWSSRYSSGFFCCMPNIDVSRKIRFSPYMKVVSNNGKDVKKTMLYLAYSDIKDEKGNFKQIEWAYTKDNPNGLPEMKQIRVKGADVWDDTERQEFFERVLNNDFIPRLSAVMQGTASSNSVVSQQQVEDESDLPF